MLHGNNKDEAELATALDVGVGRIVVDSFDEIRQARAPARGGRRRQGVLVRVTPGSRRTPTSSCGPGQEDSKFGFGLASGCGESRGGTAAPMPGVELLGSHAHIGSQIFRAGSFAEAVEILAGFLSHSELPELCIGGGLGVAYVAGESAPSISRVGRDGPRRSPETPGVPDAVRLTAEPGRSISAAAAVTLYTVGTIKELPGIRTYVSVDGGMSDNPRPVLYGSGYEAFLTS